MFDPAIISEIRKHALDCYPHECCGAVTSDGYLRQENISDTPESNFKIDSAKVRDLDVKAYVHSHCGTSQSPSTLDMQQQVATAVPWGIVATDGHQVSDVVWWGRGAPVAPLFGRKFIHGIWDCYSLIRDFYSEYLKIEIPDFPREEGWWMNGLDLYQEGFTKAGFIKFDGPITELQRGDVFLMQIRSQVRNHGGVLYDVHQVAHHLAGRLSTREVMPAYCRRPSTVWLRHTSKI
jgi:proteasome lid subunit RPN8/RPN11